LIDEAALLAAPIPERFSAGLDVMESETAFTPAGVALVHHPKVHRNASHRMAQRGSS